MQFDPTDAKPVKERIEQIFGSYADGRLVP